MRRGGGEDLDLAGPREVGERPDDVAVEPLDERALQPSIRAAVELGDGLPGRRSRDAEVPGVELRAADLIVRVRDEARADVRIRELFDERRGQPDGEPVAHALGAEVVQQHEQRQVRAEDRLVDPFLAVRPAAGAADVREV